MFLLCADAWRLIKGRKLLFTRLAIASQGGEGGPGGGSQQIVQRLGRLERSKITRIAINWDPSQAYIEN